MPDVAQLLQNLHPMREPPPPSPVAPFVAMLAAGIVLAAVGVVAWWQIRRRRAGLRRAAELALAATRDLSPPERLAAQARLLRRLVRARVGDGAARGEGEGWLATLDRAFATTFFTEGPGRAYADGLYRRGGDSDVDQLDRSLADLIGRLGAPRDRRKVSASA